MASAGSFAGGFINAFLQARRLNMENRHWQTMDQYYKQIMQQQGKGSQNPAQNAFDQGKSGSLSRSNGDGGADAQGASTKGGAFPSQQEMQAYIRERAPQFGIDPIVATKVSQSESPAGATGDGGSSFGPFQLHYGNVGGSGEGNQVTGLGDAFTKETGLDARDGSTWRQQIDFSLKQAAQNGWGAWHGAANTGIGQWDGITKTDPSKLPPLAAYGNYAGADTGASSGAPTPMPYTGNAGAPTQLPSAAATSSPSSTQGGVLSPDQVHAQLGQHAGPDNVTIDPATGQAYHWDTGLPWDPAGLNNGNTVPPPTSIPGGPNYETPPASGAQAGDTLPSDDNVAALAKGGPVKGYADGGPVDDDTSPTPESNPPLPISDASYNQGTADGSVLPVDDGTLHNSEDYVPGEDVQDTAYGQNYAMGRMETAARHAGAPRIGAPTSSGGMSSSGGMRMGTGRMPSPRMGAGGVGGIDPNHVYETPDGEPKITDGEGGLADGAVSAIREGMQAIGQMFGLKNQGAIPGDPNAAQGRQRFLDGEGAASPDEMNKIKRSVDPGGTLDDAMGNIAGLEAVHQYYLMQGNPQAAAQTAASMLLYTRETAAKYGAEAYNRLHKGDIEGGVRAMERGYDEVPDGMRVHGAVQPDGTVAVTRTNLQGDVVDQHTATPEQLFGAALGLKNGTSYWNLLNEAIQVNTQKQSGRQFSSEDQKAFDEIYGGKPAQGGGVQYLPSVQDAPGTQGQPAAPPSPAKPAPTQGQPVLPPSPANAAPPAPAAQGQGETQPPVTPASSAPPPAPGAPTQGQPVIPDNHAKGLDDFTSLTAQTYARFGVQLQPPSKFVATPSNFDNMTPQGQTALRQKQKQDLAAWQKEMSERKSLADKFVSDTLLSERQRTSQLELQDRDANNQTMRATNERNAISQRDKDAADRLEQGKQADWNRDNSKPTGLDDPSLTGGTSEDPFTHAGRILPTAATDYSKRFDAPTQQLLSGAMVNIARYSKTSPELAARAVNSIVTPSDGANDSPNYNASPDKQTGLMHVAFSDGFGVSMPQQDFVMLTNIRQAQKKQRMDAQAQETQNTARQQQETTLRGKINDENTATANAGDLNSRRQQMGLDQGQTLPFEDAGQNIPSFTAPPKTPVIPMGEDDLRHQWNRSHSLNNEPMSELPVSPEQRAQGGFSRSAGARHDYPRQ